MLAPAQLSAVETIARLTMRIQEHETPSRAHDLIEIVKENQRPKFGSSPASMLCELQRFPPDQARCWLARVLAKNNKKKIEDTNVASSGPFVIRLRVVGV